MLIVEKTALDNGAHRNQTGDFQEIPAGWVSIPADLEGEATQYLPFIRLTIDNSGVVTAVSQGPIPPSEPEPVPGYTELELAQQDITDLELSDIVQGQAVTDLEIMILEGQTHV